MSVQFPTPDQKTNTDPPQVADNPRGRTCLTCVYVGIEGDSVINCCKFMPPVRDPNGNSHWPGVHADDWCGQYAGPVDNKIVGN